MTDTVSRLLSLLLPLLLSMPFLLLLLRGTSSCSSFLTVLSDTELVRYK